METPYQNPDLSTSPDTSTPTPVPTHHRSWLVIVVVAIFILLVLSWWWQGRMGPGGSGGNYLSEEIRQQILKLLNQPNAEGEALTTGDRSEIETSLDTGSSQARPTVDERQQILDSLDN